MSVGLPLVNVVSGIEEAGARRSAGLTASGPTDVPVIPALCFVDAGLPFREKNRRVRGARLCGPKSLGRLVAAEGPLDDEVRFAIAMRLSTALPSMT